jgi:proteasome lid subunit RPN8/RPN11
VRILSKIFDAMVDHASHELPYECCGLLAGSCRRVDEIFLCRNQKRSKTEFSIAPKELFETLREIRQRRKKLLGIYHSHPNGTGLPSPRDVKEFHYPGVDFWIVSFQNGEAVVRCFEWQGEDFAEVGYSVH